MGGGAISAATAAAEVAFFDGFGMILVVGGALRPANFDM